MRFEGLDVTRIPAHEFCRLGIGQAFQIVHIFDDMTVLRNVAVCAMSHAASMRGAEAKALEVLHEVLHEVDLVGPCSAAAAANCSTPIASGKPS